MNMFAIPKKQPGTTSRPSVVINGKFLNPAKSRSGVHRVAIEILMALDELIVKHPAIGSAFSCAVVVQGDHEIDVRLSGIKVLKSRFGSEFLNGAVWEQFVLPAYARGSTLVNLCNMGPLMHRDAFTMIHDAQVHSSPESYRRLFRVWYKTMQPLLGRLNRSLLTVSQYSRAQLGRYGIAPLERTRCIHNGCDHVLRLVPDMSKATMVTHVGRPYVIGLANTQPHKNIGVLFEAFKLEPLREFTLVLFGSAKRQDFEKMGFVVPSNVEFLGYISDEQMVGLLKEAVALAFPSITEGFGLPPLEAMALGCPTVVAPCGALPEICGDATVWAAFDQPTVWATQLRRVHDDVAFREDIRARGRAHSEMFTWRNSALRLLEVTLGENAMQELADSRERNMASIAPTA